MVEDKPEALEDSLVTTIGKSGLNDILSDAREHTLDAFLKDSILKDIPVIGTLVKAYGIGVGVRDYLFVSILRFLGPLSSVSEEKRSEFVDELNQKPGERQRVGSTLMLLLDRLDELDKADILGRLFSVCVSGQIDLGEFQRLAAALDRVIVQDLRLLSSFREHVIPPSIRESFLAAGLIQVSMPAQQDGQVHYDLSATGRRMLQFGLRQDGAT